MSTADNELAEVEAALPPTWCPDQPLAVRVARLVEVRHKFLDLLELQQTRGDVLQEQRSSMRNAYLGLLRYGLRVGEMEQSVTSLLRYAEDHGTIRMAHVKAIIEARERLAEPYDVETPVGELGALEPFMRGKPKSIMLTGDRLEAFRTVLRWVHGLVREP